MLVATSSRLGQLSYSLRSMSGPGVLIRTMGSFCCTSVVALPFLLFMVSNMVGVNAKSTAKKPTPTPEGSEALLIHLTRVSLKKSEARYRRPVENTTDAITVQMALQLLHVEGLQEAGDYADLSATFVVTYSWDVSSIHWMPELYGGVREIRLPRHMLWIPDITLLNDLNTVTSKHIIPVVIDHRGRILYAPREHHRVRCRRATNASSTVTPETESGADYSAFEWQCQLKFGSWTHNGLQLDLEFLHGSTLDVISYFDKELSQFEVIGGQSVKEVKYYPCCVEPYPSLVFELLLASK